MPLQMSAETLSRGTALLALRTDMIRLSLASAFVPSFAVFSTEPFFAVDAGKLSRIMTQAQMTLQ